jgi:lysophospholipase L1-like esterase
MITRCFTLLLTCASLQAAPWRFSLDEAKPPEGFASITSATAYDSKLGYGFLPGSTADSSVLAVDVPEGNYTVTLRIGHTAKPTWTTVKAESRRLMIHELVTQPGPFETRSFTVNVRKPAIAGGLVTGLKDREKGPPPVADWDEHLTLEFDGHPHGVSSVEIQPTNKPTTLFIAGDSTVTDQPQGPFFGWGQMLPRFFKPSVSVSNHAESGLALFSFEGSRRLKKVQSMMQPGDYFFVQFGHNDQKDKRPGSGPTTSYKADLKRFIAAAREKQAKPVLVTPMERRRFSKGKQSTTLDAYAEAVREVAKEEGIPVIDLHAMSVQLYAAMGEEKSKTLFVHYPANTFPNRPEALKDDTHHSAFGSYELAKCVIEAIRQQLPELAPQLASDTPRFDPTKPDDPKTFVLPWNVHAGRSGKPDGN